MPYIIRKFAYSVQIDHSTAARLVSLLSGIYDLFSKSFTSLGAGLYRYTRNESALELIKIMPFENVKLFLQNIYYSSELFSYTDKGFPVYSFFGYLLSEAGIFSLIFILSYFSIIKKGFQYTSNKFSKFDIKNLLYVIVGTIPLSYFIYILTGYPRALPYLIVAILLFLKKLEYDFKLKNNII